MVILPVHSVAALRHYFLFTRINQICLDSTATGHFQPRVAAVNLTPLKAWGFESGICFTARYVNPSTSSGYYRDHTKTSALCSHFTIGQCVADRTTIAQLFLTTWSNILRPVTSEVITAGHDAVSLNRFGTKDGPAAPIFSTDKRRMKVRLPTKLHGVIIPQNKRSTCVQQCREHLFEPTAPLRAHQHPHQLTSEQIPIDFIQVRSKDSQVKTQLVLWIFILFKVTRWQHVSASITRPSSGHK